MMQAFFQDTFEYTHNTNEQLIVLLNRTPEVYSDRISLLFSHILNAHHIWNHRILGLKPKLGVWQELDIGELRTINLENFGQSSKILLFDDLTKPINYTNSKGENFKNSISEMLFHIINHSTYHRGQIMALMKNKGVEPLTTDYIFYKR